jgi:antitoxin component YwqK of YwqJK toxin-antitoxin module
MKKLTVLFILVASITISYGQSLTEKTIIGKWSVTKVTSPIDKMNLPESNMKEVIAMKKAFHNAVFEFKRNGEFFSKYTVENSYNNSFKKLDGKNWKLDLENELITIMDKETNESLSFGIDKNTPLSDVKFSIGGLIFLHMKKGVFKTDIDYDTKVATVKTKEKSIEEKRKELYGDGLMELAKANEARNAISHKDIKYIDGIAYLKDSNSIVKIGKIEERYENGKLKMEGWFLEGKKDEVWTWYYENGKVSKEKRYLDGKLNGLSKEWNENGQLTRTVNYKDGIKADD